MKICPQPSSFIFFCNKINQRAKKMKIFYTVIKVHEKKQRGYPATIAIQNKKSAI
jgi:hypothetical protein